MLKIKLQIPQSTIELENSRNPDKLSMDDLLYWTFETRVDFVEVEAEVSFFLIPEAALFQILKLLADARIRFSKGEEGEVWTRDREGSYDLFIKKEGEIVEISDAFNEITIQTDLVGFLKATESFVKTAIEEVEQKFPKLLLNENYIELKSQLL